MNATHARAHTHTQQFTSNGKVRNSPSFSPAPSLATLRASTSSSKWHSPPPTPLSFVVVVEKGKQNEMAEKEEVEGGGRRWQKRREALHNGTSSLLLLPPPPPPLPSSLPPLLTMRIIQVGEAGTGLLCTWIEHMNTSSSLTSRTTI